MRQQRLTTIKTLLEAAITHFIKETGNGYQGYFELNPIVYNDPTN